MNLRSEVTIDLDDKRRIWATSEAVDVDPVDVSRIAPSLAQAASASALDSYGKVVGARLDLGSDEEKKEELPPTFDD